MADLHDILRELECAYKALNEYEVESPRKSGRVKRRVDQEYLMGMTLLDGAIDELRAMALAADKQRLEAK